MHPLSHLNGNYAFKYIATFLAWSTQCKLNTPQVCQHFSAIFSMAHMVKISLNTNSLLCALEDSTISMIFIWSQYCSKRWQRYELDICPRVLPVSTLNTIFGPKIRTKKEVLLQVRQNGIHRPKHYSL